MAVIRGRTTPCPPEDPGVSGGFSFDDREFRNGLTCDGITYRAAHADFRIDRNLDLAPQRRDPAAVCGDEPIFPDCELDLALAGAAQPDEPAVGIGCGFPVEKVAF